MKFDLHAERVNRGITIATLAAATGVSRATIIRLEAGAKPQAPTAKRLADFFGVEASTFYAARPEDVAA